jgi:hypothetical protein
LNTDESLQWQSYIVELLYAHHGPSDFIPIPDKTQGDGGIEGYSKCGKAYQCYAPVGFVSEADRTEKIKTKINRDLNKFKDNQTILTKIFGATVMNRWILITPEYHDKDLVIYGHKKANDIKACNLPYVDSNDFDVLIQDDNAYPKAKRSISSSHIATLLQWNAGSTPTDELLSQWTQGNQGIVQTIEEKLGKLTSISEKEKSDARDQFVIWLIQGGNLLQKFRTNIPESYDSIMSAMNQMEGRMKVSGSGTLAGREKIVDIIALCETELHARLSNVPREIISDITHALISDWMARCPLQFKGP